MQTENFKSFYHWVLLHNFSILWRRKKKDDKKTKAFYDWATTGIPVNSELKSGQGHIPVSKHRHAMHAKVIFSRVGGLLETL